MKSKICLLLLMILTASVRQVAKGQGLINNGAFIVNSNAYIYIDGGISVGNFLNEDDGASVGKVDNTGFILVTGDWTNNSAQNVFTANTGIVELLGSDQNLGGTTTTWFNNLNLLGTGTKTLLVDQLVGGGYGSPAGILALNDRPMELNSYRLIVNNPATSAITRTSGYIISELNNPNNTSVIQWNVGAANGAYVFPFGTTTSPNYIPLTITKSGGTTDISASTRQTFIDNNSPWHFSVTQMWSQTVPGPGEIPVVIDRWWDINSPSAFTGAVDFTYRGIENTTTYAPSGTFAAQNWMGSFWNPPVGAGPGVTAGTSVVSIPPQTLGGTTPWVLSNITAPLPIELLYFHAVPGNGIVKLDWATASEINNSYFEVQRSRDNHSFETISTVAGSGNTTTARYYEDADPNPYQGLSYYRLKQVDIDESFTFSNVVPVRLTDDGKFDFEFASANGSVLIIGYYNPVPDDKVSVLITDRTGREVFSSGLSSDKYYMVSSIDLPRLSGGIYVVTLRTTEAVASKKFFTTD